jgi:hypothetical protein
MKLPFLQVCANISSFDPDISLPDWFTLYGVGNLENITLRMLDVVSKREEPNLEIDECLGMRASCISDTSAVCPSLNVMNS